MGQVNDITYLFIFVFSLIYLNYRITLDTFIYYRINIDFTVSSQTIAYSFNTCEVNIVTQFFKVKILQNLCNLKLYETKMHHDK